jgi:hypothetical protein
MLQIAATDSNRTVSTDVLAKGDNANMSRRFLAVAAAILTALIAIALAVYFVVVGLDKADKLGSVVGVFIGLAALALSIYLAITDQPDSSRPSGHEGQAPVHNRIDGGTFHGPVVQGRDISHVTSQLPEPTRPNDPATG